MCVTQQIVTTSIRY